MSKFSAPSAVHSTYQPGLDSFLRSLKHYGLTKQQIKTIRGLALSGNLSGAQKGLERMVMRHEHNGTF